MFCKDTTAVIFPNAFLLLINSEVSFGLGLKIYKINLVFL